jgi:hypothetical protein
LVLLLGSGNAHALTLSFVSAYTVAAPGSTARVTVFDINGDAPWLFVDLPALGSFSTTVNSNWFQGANEVGQFSAVPAVPSASNAHQFWLTPSEADWNAKKAAGDWHIDATFDLVGLLCAESGGICVPVSEGNGSVTVNFSVAPAVVPLPLGALLLASGLGVLGLPRIKRRRMR